MTLTDSGYPVYALWFIAPKTLNYLTFQSVEFECTWWRLFQKRVVRTVFDIYVFIETRLLGLHQPRTNGV